MTYFYMGGVNKCCGNSSGGDIPVVVKKDLIKRVTAKIEVYSYRYASIISESEITGVLGHGVQKVAEERARGMFFSENLATHPNKVNPFESVVLLNNSGSFEDGVDWFKPTGEEVSLATSLENYENISSLTGGRLDKDNSFVTRNLIRLKFDFSRFDEGHETFDSIYTKPTENLDVPLYSGYYKFASNVGTINQVIFHDGFIYAHNISNLYKLDLEYNVISTLPGDELGGSVFGIAILDGYIYVTSPGEPVKKIALDNFDGGVKETINVPVGAPYYGLMTNDAGEMFAAKADNTVVQVNPVDMEVIKKIADMETTYLSNIDGNLAGENKMIKKGQIVELSDENNKFIGDYNDDYFIMRNNYSNPPTFLQPKTFVGAFFKLQEPLTVDYNDGETLRLVLEIELEG